MSHSRGALQCDQPFHDYFGQLEDFGPSTPPQHLVNDQRLGNL